MASVDPTTRVITQPEGEARFNGAKIVTSASLGDVDGDGDLDLYFANVAFVAGADPQDRLLINDGRGFFKEATGSVLPAGLDGEGVYVEAADFNGDGRVDLYLSSYVGRDRLVLGRE